jgi:hypothetical protein
LVQEATDELAMCSRLALRNGEHVPACPIQESFFPTTNCWAVIQELLQLNIEQSHYFKIASIDICEGMVQTFAADCPPTSALVDKVERLVLAEIEVLRSQMAARQIYSTEEVSEELMSDCYSGSNSVSGVSDSPTDSPDVHRDVLLLIMKCLKKPTNEFYFFEKNFKEKWAIFQVYLHNFQ